MSTKSKDNAGANGGGDAVLQGDRTWPGLRLELAYWSGAARVMAMQRRGHGAILRFVRVRERQSGAFQPLEALDITPRQLDRLLHALRRWRFEIVSLDEACARARQPERRGRWICLSFDGADRSIAAQAYPVLAAHRTPFALYLPTAFPDGLGRAWWLALEQIVGRHERIGLVKDEREQVFIAPSPQAKTELFVLLARWLAALTPSARTGAMRDLCRRYAVDDAGLTRAASMDWDDILRLAADPLATFGAATVDYERLAALPDADALRELTMGRAVLQAALGRAVSHTAFPFGDSGSFGARHVAMAADAGFASAATCVPGLIAPDGAADPHRLPRIAWDGRRMTLRTLRALLSGVTLSPERPAAASS